jgi:hypothetical protein
MLRNPDSGLMNEKAIKQKYLRSHKAYLKAARLAALLMIAAALFLSFVADVADVGQETTPPETAEPFLAEWGATLLTLIILLLAIAALFAKKRKIKLQKVYREPSWFRWGAG